MRTPKSSENRDAGRSRSSGDASSSLDMLRRLREVQIKALAQAASGDPAIMDGLTARVQSLSAAIDTIEKIEGKARKRMFAAAVTAVVLLTGTLMLVHRPSAEITIDAKASSVSFTVTRPFAPLREVTAVTSVEFFGLARIRLEGSEEIIAGPDDALSLRVQPAIGTKHPGIIGFDSLVTPVGTQVEITVVSPGNTIELGLQYVAGQPRTLDMDALGDVAIYVNGRGKRQASFPGPARITVNQPATNG